MSFPEQGFIWVTCDLPGGALFWSRGEPVAESVKKSQVDRAEVRRLTENYRDEVDGAALYEALAAAERDPERASVLRELAGVERRHAATWAEKLEEAGVSVSPEPSLRVRLVGRLAGRVGARALLPLARAMEGDATQAYAAQPDAAALGFHRDEASHARVFSQLAKSGSADVAGHESWHRASSGGNLRAAVFGVNDGLLSNFSLMMGMAGGAAAAAGDGAGQVVVLAGFAGMLAGAFSMAAGEYVSVRSQRELFEREIAKEAEELDSSPEEEIKELELIYRAKGVPAEQAASLARALADNPDSALDTLAREELGLDPEELGSPWGAALSSFGAFVAGAVIPLAPFLLLDPGPAFWVSAGASGLALFALGALLALFTGRGLLWGGLRMFGVGCGVALATHLIGRLVGVSVS
jgi:VIT1/CCC1 family predicted Fe2+/Mn2+ transporter